MKGTTFKITYGSLGIRRFDFLLLQKVFNFVFQAAKTFF